MAGSVIRSDELRKPGVDIPSDLCEAAVKFARRVQALTPGTTYVIMIYKRDQSAWSWHVSQLENVTDKT